MSGNDIKLQGVGDLFTSLSDMKKCLYEYAQFVIKWTCQSTDRTMALHQLQYLLNVFHSELETYMKGSNEAVAPKT